MVLESLPPYRNVSSTPVSLTEASSILETYLANSEAHPHLHPDALITPKGVTFSSHGGPMGGVIMHNLRRVAAGLRGEYLEPEATPEPEEEDGRKRKGGAINIGDGKRKGAELDGEVTDAGAAEEGWQDKEEYEREEGVVEVGEIGRRDNFVTSGGDVPEVQVTEDVDEDFGRKRKSEEDKEARKKAKKERNKEHRREKEKKKTQHAE